MDNQFRLDMERFFSVFENNVNQIIYERLSPTPSSKRFKGELDEEIELFRTSVMNRIAEEANR